MKQRWVSRLSSRREAFSTRSLVKDPDRRLRSGGKETAMRRPQACREQRGVMQGNPRGLSSQTQLRGATRNGGTAGDRRLSPARPGSALLGPPLPALQRGPYPFPLARGDACRPGTPVEGVPGFKFSSFWLGGGQSASRLSHLGLAPGQTSAHSAH